MKKLFNLARKKKVVAIVIFYLFFQTFEIFSVTQKKNCITPIFI